MMISIKKEKKMLRVRILATISAIALLTGCGGNNDSGAKEQVKEQAKASAITVTENAVDTKVAKDKAQKSDGGQFYYTYDKEKNSSNYNANDSIPKTTLDAYLNIRSPYERVRITMMIKRLSTDYIIKCSPCHDDYANGVIGPSLLGKDANFIYGKIMEFKTGKKKNVLMKELVSQIDDAKLKSIAEEIANFNKEILKMRRGK